MVYRDRSISEEEPFDTQAFSPSETADDLASEHGKRVSERERYLPHGAGAGAFSSSRSPYSRTLLAVDDEWTSFGPDGMRSLIGRDQ